MSETSTYILATLVAFLVTFSSTPLVTIFARKIGVMDVPKDNRRAHKVPIPRLGGIAIFYGFIISMLCFIDFGEIPQVRSILIASLLIVAIGLVDDIRPQKAWLKLIIQIIAAFIVVHGGVRVDFVTNPNLNGTNQLIDLTFWSYPLTIIWIIGVTNAINLIDGLDGLAVGVSAIASMSLLCISVITYNVPMVVITAALVGSCLGFLPYNFNPAKIFMGDTGSTFLGFILANVAVLGLFKSYAVISIAIPVLILGLPIFDTSFAVVRRVSKGKSPMSPDRGHLHHRLIDSGFSQRETVMILYTLSAILGLAAVMMIVIGMPKALILLSSAIAIAIAGLVLLRAKRTQ